MVPGTGILAALRRKSQPVEPPAPDETKFAAREAAVLAVEQSLAGGSAADGERKGPKGRTIPFGQDSVTIKLGEMRPGEEQLELQVTPVTRVASEYQLAHLRQTAVSDEFITYGLKQGHIRVLHRFSEARALLKGHTGPVADICFVGDDVVAAGGQDGQLFAWRLSVQDGDDNAIHVEQILCAKFSPGCDARPVRVAACATGPAGVSVAAAVGNAVLLLKLPNKGEDAVDAEIDPLAPDAPARKMPNCPPQDSPTAVAVSADGRLLAAGSKHGRVYVAEITADGEALKGNTSIDTHSGAAVSSIHWLSADNDSNQASLLVSTGDGTQQAIYATTDGASSFASSQKITLEAPSGSSAFIHTALVCEKRLVVLVDTPGKAVYTLHYSANDAFDYFARFKMSMPVINFCARWDPDRPETSFEDGAVELSCVQAEAVQQYILDPALCGSEDGIAESAVETEVVTSAQEDVEQPKPAAVVEDATPSASAAAEAAVPVQRQKSVASVADSTAEVCESPPASPVAPAVTVQVPVPIVIPEPQAPAAAPATNNTPRLLTPKDLLRSAAPEENNKTTPAPAAVKVLQRPQAKPAPAPVVEPEPEVAAPTDVVESTVAPAAAAATAKPNAASGDVSAAVAEEMSGVHRKFAAHVSAMYKELLKAMKSEMASQAAQQQAAMTSLLREALAAQATAVQAERAAVMAEERAGMERLLASVSATLNRDLPTRLAESVRAELSNVSTSMASSLTPAVQQAVADALPKETSAAVKAALDKQLAASVQAALTKPLQEAFRQSFSKQLVPSFEQACQSMFMQIDKTFTQGMHEYQAAVSEPSGLASQLRESLALAQSLSAGSDGGLAPASSLGTAGSARTPKRSVDTRAELRALISSGRYDEAFSTALGLQDVTTVAWLCTQADAATVLSGSAPLLSQMVLLSLVQQLSSDMSGNVTAKLQWIREAAMVINPQDPQLASHLKPVLEQVHANLASEVPRLQGADASSCKLAMHVVHSQMTS